MEVDTASSLGQKRSSSEISEETELEKIRRYAHAQMAEVSDPEYWMEVHHLT